MGHEVAPDRAVLAHHELHHVARHAGLVQLLDQEGGHTDRLGCRLEDHCVAGRQRSEHAPGRNRVREVPRADHRHDATPRHGEPVGDHPFEELDAWPRVVLGEVDRLAHLRVGLVHRLARLVGHHSQRLEPAGPHHVRRCLNQSRARHGRHLPPRLEGVGRPTDHAVDLVGVAHPRQVDLRQRSGRRPLAHRRVGEVGVGFVPEDRVVGARQGKPAPLPGDRRPIGDRGAEPPFLFRPCRRVDDQIERRSQEVLGLGVLVEPP